MNVIELLYIRVFMALFFNVIFVNKDFKKALYVAKGERKLLVTKVVHGCIIVFLSFNAIKYFPLAYCNASINVSPFFALILSGIFLAEPPSIRQLILLTVIVCLSYGFIFCGV